MGRDQSGLSAPYPPEGEGVMPETSPHGGTRCRRGAGKVKAEHPAWIGDRDGVPVPVRSEVNKSDSTANSPTCSVS